jgi:hypothetical protein
VIRLTAAVGAGPPGVVDIWKVEYPLLEFVPCTVVEVDPGPPLVITVPGHGLSELAPAVLRLVEDVVGSRLTAEELPD